MLHTYIMLMFNCTNIRKMILLVPIVSSGFDDFPGSPPGSDHTEQTMSHPRRSRDIFQNRVFDSGERGHGNPTEGDHNLFDPHTVSKYRNII